MGASMACCMRYSWWGTSVGPVLAGATFDHFGNYRVAEILLGTCLALAALVSLALPRFRPEPGA
jgi:cyanate permease